MYIHTYSYNSALHAHKHSKICTHAPRHGALLPVWCADLFGLSLIRMIDSGVATVSRIDKMICLFCKRAL